MAFYCVIEAMENLALTLGMTKKLDTPQLLLDQDNNTSSSTKDWILTTNRSSFDITLNNLRTKAMINIPPIPYLTSNHVIHKAVLSSSFNGHNIMVIYGEEKELASYNLGTKRWSLLQKAGTRYDDVICHGNEFYAVDEYGKVVHYRFDNCWYFRQLVSPWCFLGQKVYLVVAKGDLFVIIRYVSRDHSDNCGRTYLFRVFVLVLAKNGYNFKEVAGLDEYAILISQNQAVALPVWKSRGLRASCIYFRDDCNHLNGSQMRGFCMEEECVEVVEGDVVDELNRVWQEHSCLS